MLSIRDQAAPARAEQNGNEGAFTAQLRQRECNNVKAMVAGDCSPRMVLRVVENAHALAEMVFEDNRQPEAPQVACRAGCSWCCRQTVMVTAPEVLRIVNFIQGMEEGTRERAITRLRDLDSRTRGLGARAREKVRTPCAFLENHRCTIYQARPLVCSQFTSLNVKDCIRGYYEGFAEKRCVATEPARTVVFRAVRGGMREGLSEALPAADTECLEMTAAVVDALEWPDATASWIAGEPVFAKAHLADE